MYHDHYASELDILYIYNQGICHTTYTCLFKDMKVGEKISKIFILFSIVFKKQSYEIHLLI